MENTVHMFNIRINNLNMSEVISRFEETIKAKKQCIVVTANVHHINILLKDEEFQKIYKNAGLVVPDGTGLILASRILGKALKERVAGSDILPQFCCTAANKKYRLFFLGAEPGIAKKAALILTKLNPGLQIVGTYSPPFNFEHDARENEKIVNLIKKCRPDVLFIGLGSPKGEKWSWNYKDEINVPIIISVGAAFDFIAMKTKRAPLWMQNVGLEWFHRLLREPCRLWKRYLVGNSVFMWLFLKELITTKVLNTPS